MNLPLTTPPSWAYDYCYFFYFLAAIQFFAGAYAISKIIVKNPTVAAILALSIVINCLTTRCFSGCAVDLFAGSILLQMLWDALPPRGW